MAFTPMLPGQPIPLPRGPAPQLGGGTYLLDGQVRAALVGVPSYDGPVGIIPRPVAIMIVIPWHLSSRRCQLLVSALTHQRRIPSSLEP